MIDIPDLLAVSAIMLGLVPAQETGHLDGELVFFVVPLVHLPNSSLILLALPVDLVHFIEAAQAFDGAFHALRRRFGAAHTVFPPEIFDAQHL